MEYEALKNEISTHLNSAAEDFFLVGYFLRQINEEKLFAKDGYNSIWEFAKAEFGLSTSSASRFMAINARFSIGNGEHMAEKYIGMGVSKLQEMLGLPDEELANVTRETTVREIREMKKKKEEPLSFFGLPKTVRPEGSLITTPGCGDGKYDCSSCAHPCGIRQEERYCRTAPMGNPFACTQMNEKKRLDIEAGMFSKECQFLNLENAETRAGDHEPTPCCKNCKNITCFSRCDVAKGKDKKEQEQQRKLREKEADRKRLQDEAERLVKEAVNKEADQKKMEVAKQAQLKAMEDDFIKDFYEKLYESEKILIKDRRRADITKLFKKEYGESYNNHRSPDGACWSCFPDKICFTLSGLGTALQITWGKFTTKLLDLLDTYPEIEEKHASKDEKEPEIIDAEFTEVETQVITKDNAEPIEIACSEPDPDPYVIDDAKENPKKMNGYKLMSDSYRKLASEGRISKEDADAEIRVFDFLAESSKEDIFRLVNSSAFNEIIKAYAKRAISACTSENTAEMALAELNHLLDTVPAEEIIKER